MVRGKSRRSLTDRLVEIHTGVAEVIAALKPGRDGLGGIIYALRSPSHGDTHGPCPGRNLSGRCRGRHTGDPLLGHADQKNPHRRGRASKAQVQRAIQRELALPQVPDPPDVADALAVALCHYYLKDKLRVSKIIDLQFAVYVLQYYSLLLHFSLQLYYARSIRHGNQVHNDI